MAIPVTKKLKIMNLNKIKNKADRDSAKEEIAEYLQDTVLDLLSQGKSPVSGEKAFKPLSKSYKKIKSKISGSSKPNMELHGDMLDDFDVRFIGNTLSMGFHGDASEESKLKAENHNKFTARSRKTAVPQRRFIPLKDQKLKDNIIRDIKDIIENYVSED